jgi:hypothetical protein
MAKISLATTLFLALMASPHVFALSPKIPVLVDHSGKDNVGQQYAFELKEGIRASQAFRLVVDSESPHVAVRLVSVAEDSQENLASAVAYTIAYDSSSTPGIGILLTMGVNSCGRTAVKRCALGLLPKVDRQVDALREKWPEYFRRLK